MSYYPDELIRIDDRRGADDLLNLIVEISGQLKKEKQAKVETATKMRVPAVNTEGKFARWQFIEIVDPWDGKTAIRKFLTSLK